MVRGVQPPDEAMQIRNEGLDDPILILSYTQPDKAAQLAKYNIAQSVFDRRGMPSGLGPKPLKPELRCGCM